MAVSPGFCEGSATRDGNFYKKAFPSLAPESPCSFRRTQHACSEARCLSSLWLKCSTRGRRRSSGISGMRSKSHPGSTEQGMRAAFDGVGPRVLVIVAALAGGACSRFPRNSMSCRSILLMDRSKKKMRGSLSSPYNCGDENHQERERSNAITPRCTRLSSAAHP